MRVPRYGTASLAEFMPSIAAALGDPAFANTLGFPQAQHAVAVLVDGLGLAQLAAYAEDAPTLARALESPAIDAAFPTTTPVGLGSLGLGAVPGFHGMVGATFRLPETGEVLRPLAWAEQPLPAMVQPEETFFERTALPVRYHGPRAYADSGLTRAVLRAAAPRPYDRLDDVVLDPDVGIDHVYIPELDKSGHFHGVGSREWRADLRRIDTRIADYLERLPSTSIVCVTSDHGMRNIDDADRIDIDASTYRAGVDRLAGEPRMRHIYTGQPQAVAARWAAALGDRAHILLREDAIALGLFGAVEPGIDDRIGDIIAIARDGWALCAASFDAKVSALRGLHGGLTDDELLVPALALHGVA